MADEIKAAPAESAGMEASEPAADIAGSADADSGVYETDAIAELLSGGKTEGDGQADEPAPGTPPAAQAGAQGQAAAPATDGQQPAADAEHPAPAMPEGWEAAEWQALPPAAQEKIAAAVTRHASALAQEVAARQQMAAEKERFTAQVNAEVSQALATMRQIVEGEFSQVNWEQLAASDPASYVQLQRMYNDRMQAVQQIQQALGARVEQIRQERAAAAEKALAQEKERVTPELQALFGAGYDGAKFAAAARSYLRSQGVPDEAISGLSNGYEVKLIAKAMLYDYQAKQRAAARKKVAEAPRVAATSAAGGQAEGNGRLKKAMARLAKNPSSTDAIAEIFDSL